jgi:hypothetical protein
MYHAENFTKWIQLFTAHTIIGITVFGKARKEIPKPFYFLASENMTTVNVSPYTSKTRSLVRSHPTNLNSATSGQRIGPSQQIKMGKP